MFQWYAIFAIGITEALVALVIIFPTPLNIKRKILTGIHDVCKQPKVQYVIRTIFVIVAFLFVDSIRDISEQLTKIEETTASTHTDTQMALHLRLFRAQRNTYLTGITLFLFLIIWRILNLVTKIAALEAKSGVVEKQAKNQQDTYLKLVDDHKELEKTVDEYKKKAQDFDVLKKQAENQEKEYLRLIDENSTLHDQARKSSGEKKDD